MCVRGVVYVLHTPRVFKLKARRKQDHSRTNRERRVCHTNDLRVPSAQPEPPLSVSPLALCRRRLKNPTKLLFLSKHLGARAAVAFEQAEALLTLPCGTW